MVGLERHKGNGNGTVPLGLGIQEEKKEHQEMDRSSSEWRLKETPIEYRLLYSSEKEDDSSSLTRGFTSSGKKEDYTPEIATAQTGIAITQPGVAITKTPSSYSPSPMFLEIMRAEFLNPIFDALQDVQPYAETSEAAVYMDIVLHKILELENKSPNDPLLEVLSAFYDAIAGGRWAAYKGNQYAEARKVLMEVSKKTTLYTNAIERTIIKLEDIGFDTTPYPLDIEENPTEK